MGKWREETSNIKEWNICSENSEVLRKTCNVACVSKRLQCGNYVITNKNMQPYFDFYQDYD